MRFLQPHQFRLEALLPPAEVARASLAHRAQQAQQQPGGAAAPATLPYVPEFLFLAAAVKIDTRLLLRHAEGAAGSDNGGAGSVAAWAATGASAVLSSPTCFVRTLAQLLWGSSSSSSGSRLAAPPAPEAVSPVQPPAGPLGGAPAPLRQQSAEWSLAAVGCGGAAQQTAPSSSSSNSRSSSSSSAAAGGGISAPAPASTLQHAVSIAPMTLLRGGSGGSAGSPSRSGTGGDGDDSGHLMAAAAAMRAAEGGQRGAAAPQQQGTLYDSIASLMSAYF